MYYGAGVIPIVLWATTSVLIYLRIRRLWPFIICHAAYDIGLTFRNTYHEAYVIMAITAAVIALGFTIRWARWSPRDEAPAIAAPAQDSVDDWPIGSSPIDQAF